MIGALSLGLCLAQPWPDAGSALEAARAAERRGDPQSERAACQAAVELSPTPVLACADRLQRLAEMADPDGGLAGLARLEAARRSPQASERMRALEADPLVGRAVRATAAATLAAQALRAGQTGEALDLTGRWWPGEDLPAELVTRLGRLRVQALVAAGDPQAARVVEAALAIPGGEVDRLEQQSRLDRAAPWAAALLVAWALVAAPLAARGWSRKPRPRPLGLLVLALVGGGGALLGGLWAPETLLPFLALLTLLALVHLLALGAALALGPRGRPAFGAASALATLAAAFLVLHRTGMLPWLGL